MTDPHRCPKCYSRISADRTYCDFGCVELTVTDGKPAAYLKLLRLKKDGYPKPVFFESLAGRPRLGEDDFCAVCAACPTYHGAIVPGARKLPPGAGEATLLNLGWRQHAGALACPASRETP